MSEKIVQLNEAVIKSELKELVRGSVEETLNELLEAEAEKLTYDKFLHSQFCPVAFNLFCQQRINIFGRFSVPNKKASLYRHINFTPFELS